MTTHTDQDLVKIAFARIITSAANFIVEKNPVAAFADLRYHEPESPPIECDLSSARSVEFAGAPLAAQRNYYRELVAEIRRFEPAQMLFTSLEPGQGVSFTTLNIADLWRENFPAEQVLYLEFYMGESPDFADVHGEIFTDAHALENYLLYVPSRKIFALRVAASAVKLDGMTEIWKRLTASFNRIFVDCSPFNYNPVGAWLASKCRGAALVAQAAPVGETVQRVVTDLENIGGRFMGVILNAVKPVQPQKIRSE